MVSLCIENERVTGVRWAFGNELFKKKKIDTIFKKKVKKLSKK